MPFPFKNCSCVLLFSGEASDGPEANFFKHAGADIDGSVLVWSRRGKRLLTSTMNERKARALVSYPVSAFGAGGSAQALRKLAPRGKIGLDYDHISAARLQRLEKYFGARRLADVAEALERLRSAKSPGELAKMAQSVRIAKEILSNVKLTPSMTELDAVRELRLMCVRRGVDFSFPPIVGSGPNSAKPHHSPSSRRLGTG
ncbi:MAG: M24 family metallopeptidase, partial [Candidatus Micrarchaeota archaeon]|nr:M24 family metallopeptidase [Candidatus Micrarchaeota archaeon]